MPMSNSDARKRAAERNNPPAPEWQAFLVDANGFVLDDPTGVLALVDDLDQIERKYGDCIPETITVCRGDARPGPQSPGSEFLRQPASRRCIDFIDLDIHDEEDPDRVLILWTAAQGMAAALNAAAA